MSEKQIIIVGAGGHGSELASYVRDLAAQGKPIQLLGFVDEKRSKGPFCGSEVLGGLKELEDLLHAQRGTTCYYITAVGDNPTRSRLVREIEGLSAKNLQPWILSHPTAQVGSDVDIGEGTCLAPGSIVTARSQIGRHCILNVHTSVSHDCELGNFVNLNPGVLVCGEVHIGKGAYIGAGATIIDKISIGEGSIIGAGAVVVDDIPAEVTAVGVPARVIKGAKAKNKAYE